MTPETHQKTLERIAEGQRAATAREVFGKTLDDLVEAKLTEADSVTANHGDMNPTWAYGALKEICAWRRIKKHWDQKVTVGLNAAATLVPADSPDGDAGH